MYRVAGKSHIIFAMTKAAMTSHAPLGFWCGCGKLTQDTPTPNPGSPAPGLQDCTPDLKPPAPTFLEEILLRLENLSSKPTLNGQWIKFRAVLSGGFYYSGLTFFIARHSLF
jgi:hypothetical protein